MRYVHTSCMIFEYIPAIITESILFDERILIEDDVNNVKKTQAKFKVLGMTCASCVNKIERFMKGRSGRYQEMCVCVCVWCTI